MQRFFVSFPLDDDIRIVDIDILHQVCHVLRARTGDIFILFSATEGEWQYTITEIGKKYILAKKMVQVDSILESKLHVTLYQAMPNKFEKIEYIIQKGVEVGIRRFIFFRSDRSQKLIITPQKQERFLSIAYEALEQCLGIIPPEILFMEKIDFSVVPKEIPQVVLDATGVNSSLSEFIFTDQVAIWVGPEGGWSEIERDQMHGNSFIFARFGGRVLRTETAGPAVAFAFINR